MNRAEKELGNNEWELSESDYLILGDSMIIVPTGRHHVFLYTHKSDSFKRLDKSKYHGHNFGRKLILHDGEIYAFGGYGFWKSHSKLIRFDLKSGEWNIVQLKGDVISGMPQLINHSGDSITIYGTAVTNQELGEKYWTREIYTLDLNTFTVVKFRSSNTKEFVNEQFLFPNWNYQYSSYIVFGSLGNIQYVVDKKSGKVFNNVNGPSISQIPTETRRRKKLNNNFSVLKGDSIFVINKTGDIESWDLKEYIELYCGILFDIAEHEPEIKEGESSTWPKFLLGGLVILFTIIIVYVLIRRERVKLRKWNGVYEEITKETNGFSKVRWLSSGVYSEKELDIALNIIHLPYDARKVKRSRELFKINEAMPGFIEKRENKKKPDQWEYQINNTS